MSPTHKRLFFQAAVFPILLTGVSPCWSQGEGRLHVVIVTDDEDRYVGRHVAFDKRNLLDRLAAGVAEDRLDVHVVPPTEMTGVRILREIDQVPVRPDDALFFYYSGHGASDKEKGHYFQLSDTGEVLLRSDVRRTMEAKRPRLGVLVSDCCYSHQAIRPKDNAGVPKPLRATAKETKPLLDHLFFQSSQFVDITSSEEGQVSMCCDAVHQGSLFTWAFCRFLGENADTRRSWENLFWAVRKTAADDFQSEYPQGVPVKAPGNEKRRQDSQLAKAFSLPGAAEGRGPKWGFRSKAIPLGVRVQEVIPDYPASVAGLQVGDVILEINGTPVTEDNDVDKALTESGPVMRMKIRNAANGEVRELLVRSAY